MTREPFESGQSGSPDLGPESGRNIRAAVERQLGETQRGRSAYPPPAISDHLLLQRIGSGAYGEVWLARSTLGTLRAVKIVHRACFEDERPYHREFNGILKYEPISRSHPGLMQVLHVGRNDSAGFFYYVMELADNACEAAEAGGSSTQGPEEKRPAQFRPKTLRSEPGPGLRLPLMEAARLTHDLAGALAHLHTHGLVHRDIKPANVIFVAGQPKLADIGLVTTVGDSRSFVGTEGFVPPEGPGTAQADLYGLGKLLYELATGRDRMDFPQLPAELTKLPEGEALLDLNEVITRACAPEARERYATTGQMQADLKSFLSGRSLRAARKVERQLAWLKCLAAAAVIFLLLAAGALWMAKSNERRALQRARSEAALRARAEAAERATQQQLYTALLEQARATVRSQELGQRVRSLDALRRAAVITNTAELRQAAMTALALPDLRFERELAIGPDYTMAELNPAFDRIAMCKGSGPTEIRSVADQRLLATLAASTNLPAYVASWSPDGRYLAVKRNLSFAGDRSEQEIWDVKNPRRVLLLPEAAFGACCFHSRLPQLLGSTGGGSVSVWDLKSGIQLARFGLAGDPICLAISPEGQRFAAACQTKSGWTVSVHRMEDGALLTSYLASDLVGSLDWHPAGRWIGVADHSGAVFLLDSWTGARRPLGRHKAQAVLARFSPDGGYMLSGGWERELIFWDLNKMERSSTLRLGSFSARFREDGRECALITSSGVQFHSFELPLCQREFEEDLGGRVRCAALSPDGRWLAASGFSRVGVWDLSVPGPAAVAAEGADARLFFSPSGELFASKDDGALRWLPKPAASPGTAPTLSPLPIATPDRFASLCIISNQVAWTTSHGTRLSGPDDISAGKGNWVSTAPGINGASPDGRWLAVYRSFTPWLHVYRLPTMESVSTITNQDDIGGFTFSPSGAELAVTSSETVRFWSTSDWKLLREVAHCKDVLYSPREPAIWLTRDYGEAGLYDSRTLRLLAPLPAGWLPLALSPDGRRLAVCVEAQSLQIWDLEQLRDECRSLGMDWPRANPR